MNKYYMIKNEDNYIYLNFRNKGDFMKRLKHISNFKKVMIEYTKSNSKEYILAILIFVIGLFLGVMFINNCSEEKANIITTYISDFIQNFQGMEKINNSELLLSSIKNNTILLIIIWIAGTTIIGMPVVLGLILFRGFCLGYTISAITFTLGVKSGIIFCLLTLFLQNILFIPALLTTGVSSIKLYKSIVNDRRKENIKVSIIKHTMISIIMLGFLLMSSFIENEISIRLLRLGIKYIV